MKQPLFQDDAFLAMVAEAQPPGSLRLWWLGQSGYLVRCDGTTLLIDPYLSDSLTEKYATTDKPHVRITERVIAPERLGGIDLVTSSHNHTDHLDRETLLPIFQQSPEATFLLPRANVEFAANRLGRNPDDFIGLDDGERAELCGLTVHGIAAAHNALEQNARGEHLFMGWLFRIGRWSIYHSGDCLPYPGLVEKLRALGKIDLALLPINGNRPERKVAGNFDGREAAELAHAVGAGLVIPCHYDLFEFNTADPHELFVPVCEHLQQPCRVLREGEALTLS